MIATLLKCFNAVKKIALSWVDKTSAIPTSVKIPVNNYENIAFFAPSDLSPGHAMAINADMSNFYKTSDNGSTWVKYDLTSFKTKYTNLGILKSTLNFAYKQSTLVVFGNDSTTFYSNSSPRAFYSNSTGGSFTESNFNTVVGNGFFATGKLQLINGNFIIGMNNYDVLFNNANGKIVTSPDGITWTATTISSLNAPTFFIYGNGKYIGLVGKKAYISTDLITWTLDTTYADSMPYFASSPTISGGIYGNGTFVIIADKAIMYSTDDCKSWQCAIDYNANSGTPKKLLYANSKFYLFSTGMDVVTSTNGISWVSGTSNSFVAIDFFYGANSKFILMDQYGSYQYSSDAITWTTLNALKDTVLAYTTSYVSPIWEDSLFADNKFFIVGASTGKLIYSTDNGNTWINPYETSPTTSLENIIGTYAARKIKYLNGLYLVVSDYGIATSINGIDWIDTVISNITNQNPSIKDIAYGNGYYVATGSCTLTSTDGTNWTWIKDEATSFFSIAFGNGTFVKGGGGTTIEYSINNGLFWSAATINTSGRTLRKIIFANGKFIALDYNGYIYTSTNGATWTILSSSSLSSKIATSALNIIYTGSVYIAIGYSNGFIAACVSNDLITWTNFPPGSTIALYALSYGNGKVITAGNSSYCFVGTL